MTVVFVHGNPETAAIWRPLLAELTREDVVTLSPPGFGAPVPEGFGATFDEYVAWLVAELETLGEAVDLVGHDWGSNHVLRVACERPDLLRSWCADTGGAWAPDYVWHESAHIWQTADTGEAAIGWWLDLGTAGRTSLNESLGMTREIAAEVADGFDEAMGRCILGVYRSIRDHGLAPWRDRLPAASARPGLILIPTADEYTGGEALHRWTAEQTGARVAVLEDLGHWWMLQDPTAGAQALARFWETVEQEREHGRS
jgi:pimeloyl-ACP methyl ester carboxylesterase